MDIETIEQHCADLERQRTTLRQRVQKMREEQARVRERHMPGIRQAVAEAREAREQLQQDVEISPELFQRPKTRTLHNIRVGYKKRPGRISFPSVTKTIALIREKLPKKARDLIRTKEELDKAAARKLAASDIQRIGGQITHDTDEPVVEPTGDDVDKAVDALIQTDNDIDEAAA